MRDLVRESGLPRETIHFYRQQGLLPEPVKTGRNTALYTQEHVERLRRIRELQERQFLPLKAIRAVLDDTVEEGFTPEQEDLVRQVRATLSGWSNDQQRPAVAVADFVPERLSRDELRELTDAGLVTVQGAARGGCVSEDDAVILECWAQFKEAGLGPQQGVGPAELRIYDEAMERLVTREARMALRAYAGSPRRGTLADGRADRPDHRAAARRDAPQAPAPVPRRRRRQRRVAATMLASART